MEYAMLFITIGLFLVFLSSGHPGGNEPKRRKSDECDKGRIFKPYQDV